MRRDPELVKKPRAGALEPPLRAAFGRHFSGYELGLITLGMVLTFAALTLPRASVPGTLPLPRVDRAQLERREARERIRVQRARAQGLPFEVRAVGESVRHFGQQAARGFDTAHDAEDLRERVKLALAKNQSEHLLELRAVQTQLFLDALQNYERVGQSDRELDELGGAFVVHAKKNGWFDTAGQCVADATTRAVLFRIYWAELLGMGNQFPFAPSLDEWRVYYGYLLRHPDRGLAPQDAGSDEASRLRIVEALARKDPDYPALFAKGYLYQRLGDPRAAATAFRSHLATHEQGPYALLARNYLIYTLREGRSE